MAQRDRGTNDDHRDSHDGLPIVYAPRGGGLVAITGRVQPPEPKAAEVTASRIVQDMVTRRSAPGDRLPTEPEMLERYGVSRESMREALRLLEMQGILVIKRGPGGGPYVAPLNSSYLAHTASLYFHLSGATHAELFETWELLEPSLAARVAERGDKRTKREIFAPYLEYDPDNHQSLELFEDLNDFHAVVATLSGNRVLTLVNQSVTNLVVERVISSLDPADKRAMITHSHRDIAEAMIEGRASKARRLMADHIREVTETFRQVNPEVMSQRIEWRI